jgi:hypothetical protein
VTASSRKWKDEEQMAKTTRKVEIPDEVRPVVAAAAKNLATHLWGTQGPAWGTSFSSLEDLTAQITELLGSQLLQQALSRQADQPLPQPLQVCPTCSGPLDERPPEPRSVLTTVGTADWQEPARYCPRCRRAFFPSVGEPGHRPD